MSIVYIVAKSGRLVQKNKTLRFIKPDGEESVIFSHNTDSLIIIGNIELSGCAIKLLMRNNIETVFMSTKMKYYGKLFTMESKNILLRQKQYRFLDDNNFKINFARDIIRGKIKNQISFMQRINRKHKREDKNLNNRIRLVKEQIKSLENQKTLDALRGVEGYCARQYFSIFKLNIHPQWANFNGRSSHPPKDNVNAVLSFLYSLLLSRIDSAIRSVGLDCYVGYLHSLEYGKTALAFDLMEEFRTPVADTLTCALFNLGILTETDFHREDIFDKNTDATTSTGKEDKSDSVKSQKSGIYLTEQAVKKVISQFEKKMNSSHNYYEKSLSLKMIILEQAASFKKFINGEIPNYTPLYIK